MQEQTATLTAMTQQFWGKWTAIVTLGFVGAWTHIPHTVQILLILMGLDVLSGLIAAGRTRSLNSSVMVRGLFQKLAVFPLLVMLHVVEAPLKLSFELESVIACAFILYEAMSITENAARAGVPIPKVVVDALVKAKIKTASADEIRKQFSIGDETKVSLGESSEIVKTPDSQPDLKVNKKITVLEETHVEQIPPDLPKDA